MLRKFRRQSIFSRKRAAAFHCATVLKRTERRRKTKIICSPRQRSSSCVIEAALRTSLHKSPKLQHNRRTQSRLSISTTHARSDKNANAPPSDYSQTRTGHFPANISPNTQDAKTCGASKEGSLLWFAGSQTRRGRIQLFSSSGSGLSKIAERNLGFNRGCSS